MIDSLALRLFVEVARFGSFSAAGRELGYSQPAVTYQIHNLEKSVGTPLTVRRGRDTALTDAGRELLIHAQQILAAVRGAEEAMAAFAGGPRGVVRLAAFPSCYATLVAEAVADVGALHPDLEVVAIEAEPTEARRQVRAGEIDLAVSYRFAPSSLDSGRSGLGAVGVSSGEEFGRSGLHAVPLLAEQMWAILRPDHPAADRDTIAFADVVADPILVSTERFAAMVGVAAAGLGAVPTLRTVADDFVAMQTMVAHGLGVALVPDLGLAAHRDSRIVAAPLADWPQRLVEIELWPDLLRLDAVQAVIDALHRAAQRLTAAAAL